MKQVLKMKTNWANKSDNKRDSLSQVGCAKANGREPKTCLCQVFNYKLGCFNDVHVFLYLDACPHL